MKACPEEYEIKGEGKGTGIYVLTVPLENLQTLMAHQRSHSLVSVGGYYFVQNDGCTQGYHASPDECSLGVRYCEVEFIRLLVQIRMYDLAYRISQTCRYCDDVFSRYYAYFYFFKIMTGMALDIEDTNLEDRNSAEFLDTTVIIERTQEGVGRLVIRPFSKRDKYPLLRKCPFGESFRSNTPVQSVLTLAGCRLLTRSRQVTYYRDFMHESVRVCSLYIHGSEMPMKPMLEVLSKMLCKKYPNSVGVSGKRHGVYDPLSWSYEVSVEDYIDQLRHALRDQRKVGKAKRKMGDSRASTQSAPIGTQDSRVALGSQLERIRAVRRVGEQSVYDGDARDRNIVREEQEGFEAQEQAVQEELRVRAGEEMLRREQVEREREQREGRELQEGLERLQESDAFFKSAREVAARLSKRDIGGGLVQYEERDDDVV